MGRLADATREKMLRDIARAAAAGHDANRLETTRKGTPGVQHGTRAICSCGWESTPRARKVLAASAAYYHVLEVCSVLDQRGRLDLVEWSAAPTSGSLHRASKARGHADSAPASPKAS